MRACVVVVATVALFLAPCARADMASEELELKAGTVTVTVRDHDGQALADAELTVLTAEGETELTIQTNAKGKCEIEDLEAGGYRLIVADRGVLPFAVSEKGEVDSILVVLPPPARYASGDAEKAFALPTLAVFIVGALVVVTGGYFLFRDGSSTGGGAVHPE